MPADLKMDDKSVPKPKLIFESCGSRERPDGINESVKVLTDAGLKAVGYVSPVRTANEGIEELVFCDNALLTVPDTDTIIAAVYPAWLVIPGHEVIKTG